MCRRTGSAIRGSTASTSAWAVIRLSPLRGFRATVGVCGDHVGFLYARAGGGKVQCKHRGHQTAGHTVAFLLTDRACGCLPTKRIDGALPGGMEIMRSTERIIGSVEAFNPTIFSKLNFFPASRFSASHKKYCDGPRALNHQPCGLAQRRVSGVPGRQLQSRQRFCTVCHIRGRSAAGDIGSMRVERPAAAVIYHWFNNPNRARPPVRRRGFGNRARNRCHQSCRSAAGVTPCFNIVHTGFGRP